MSDNNDHVFRLDRNGSSIRSFSYQQITTGGYGAWTLSDVNLDTIWTFDHNGNELGGGLNESFNAGVVVTNGERHSSIGDIAWSHFDGMQFLTGSGWNDWSNTFCYLDNDSDYSNHIVAANNIYVDVRSGSC